MHTSSHSTHFSPPDKYIHEAVTNHFVIRLTAIVRGLRCDRKHSYTDPSYTASS